jgi:heme exporter protein C
MLSKFFNKITKYCNYSSINNFYQKTWITILTISILLILIGTALIFQTPADYLQGHWAKIMYIHIPAAWLCLIIYFYMTISSIVYLAYKNLFFAFLAYAISFPGLIFNIICVISGMIWGKLTWGAWWVWDARLSSVFVLMIFYIAFILTFHAIKQEKKQNFKIAAIINLLGAINLPIIKFSVEIYNSVHQKSSFLRKSGVAINKIMLYPLWFILIGLIGITLLYSLYNLLNYLSEKKQFHKQIHEN